MRENITRYFHSQLSRKGLIVIAIPVIFSIIFIVGLKVLLSEARAQADREAKSRIVLSSKNTLAAAVINAISDRYMSRFIDPEAGEQRYKKSADAVLDRYKELHDAIQPGTEQATIVDRIGLKLIGSMNIMNGTDFTKKSSLDVAALAELMAKRRKLEVLMNSLLEDSDALAEAERKCKPPPVSYERFKQIINLVLLVGVFIEILLAAGLMMLFGVDMTRRLSVLMDNSRNLVDERQLNPPVAGKDEIARLDSTFHDMAARLAEARARERAVLSRLKSIIDTIPLGLVVTDEHGLIDSLNPGAEELFGYEAANLEKQPITRLFSFPEGYSAERAVQDLLQTAPASGREMESVRQDGSVFQSEVLSTQYHSTTMDGRLFIVSDITERYEIERMKQSFIAMVSHELRSPLTSIQLCLEMLHKQLLGPMDEQGISSVKMAERSTKRLISLVNEILDVERLASGSIVVNPKPVSMNSILNLAVGSVAGAAEAAEINVLAYNAEIDVMADEDRIVQVLVNFMSNAIKFSPKGSTIGLTARTKGNLVEIRVRDQGRGIPKDQLQLVFEKFHQVSRSDNSEKGGAGLGLAICKAIVEAHGGEIGADSIVGTGSTFWLRIPLCNKDEVVEANKVNISREA